MHEWRVTLTQHGTRRDGREGRWIAAVVTALDANDARRRAQRVHPGWTAVLAERLDETTAARAQRVMSGDLS